jgi:hypothetical protein
MNLRKEEQVMSKNKTRVTPILVEIVCENPKLTNNQLLAQVRNQLSDFGEGSFWDPKKEKNIARIKKIMILKDENIRY